MLNRLKRFKHSKFNWNTVIFSTVFIFYSFISSLIIPSADDYFWWGKMGSYMLRHNFISNDPTTGGSSNGRYIGNTVEILIMHSPIFAILFYAATITLLLWCIYQLSGKTHISLIFSLLFIFLTPFSFTQQVFYWYNGFAIYLPSIALLLTFFVLLEKVIRNGDTQSRAIYPQMFFVSLVGGLFVEHITICQVLVGMISLLMIFMSNKRNVSKIKIAPLIYYLSGALLSALIMFSHQSYMHNSSAYRKVGFTIQGAINNYFNITHFWFSTFNLAVILMILLSTLIISIKTMRTSPLKMAMVTASITLSLYYVFISIFIRKNFGVDDVFVIQNIQGRKIAIIDGIVTILFYIFIVLTILVFYKLTMDNLVTYLFLFCGIFLILPFLYIISPVYSREYFASYVFLFIIGILLMNRALPLLNLKITTVIMSISVFFIFVGSFNMITKMEANYQANLTRVQDKAFLHKNKQLKTYVPYRRYVLLNDMKIMQSPQYWQHRLHFKFSDYFYNSYTN